MWSWAFGPSKYWGGSPQISRIYLLLTLPLQLLLVVWCTVLGALQAALLIPAALGLLLYGVYSWSQQFGSWETAAIITQQYLWRWGDGFWFEPAEGYKYEAARHPADPGSDHRSEETGG